MEVDPIREKENIQKLKNADNNMRNRVMIEIGLNTGFRISDLLKIKVKDVISNSSYKSTGEKN